MHVALVHALYIARGLAGARHQAWTSRPGSSTRCTGVAQGSSQDRVLLQAADSSSRRRFIRRIVVDVVALLHTPHVAPQVLGIGVDELVKRGMLKHLLDGPLYWWVHRWLGGWWLVVGRQMSFWNLCSRSSSLKGTACPMPCTGIACGPPA